MKNFWFIFLALTVITFSACNEDDGHMHDDDGDYDVTIQIMSPADAAEVTVDEVAHVHVELTRPESKTIHNVLVEVLDADGNVVNTLKDEHVHEAGAYSFHSDDFTPGAHGAYTLRVTSTNDAGEKPVVAERAFTAVHGQSNTEYMVHVEIIKPGDDPVAINQEMAVEVNYRHHHGDIIHNIHIDVIDENMVTVGTIVDNEHVHTMAEYTFEKSDAWTPTTAGTYTLRAMTTDMAGENMNMVMKELTVQ